VELSLENAFVWTLESIIFYFIYRMASPSWIWNPQSKAGRSTYLSFQPTIVFWWKRIW